MFIEMIMDGEVNPKRRHRPKARGGNLVVLWTHRHVPRADPSNVDEPSDRYHSHRSMVERFQQRILLPDSIELESVVSGDPVGRCGATGRDSWPIEPSALPILSSCCRRK